jgi:hypothetical protein
MITKTASILSVAILLSACANHPIHAMQTPFDAAEAVKYSRKGTASIKGQAFLKRNDGQVVTCAGSEVRLMPDTAYENEIISAIKHGERIDPAVIEDDKAKMKAKGATGHAERKSICDAQGNFSFTDIPAENWIVVTDVTWFVSTIQGGMLLKHVTTEPNKTSDAILTGTDRF